MSHNGMRRNGTSSAAAHPPLLGPSRATEISTPAHRLPGLNRVQGMRLLVQHHIGLLVQNLMAWRQQVTDEIKKAYSTGSGGPGGGSSGVLNVQGICKRVRELLSG